MATFHVLRCAPPLPPAPGKGPGCAQAPALAGLLHGVGVAPGGAEGVWQKGQLVPTSFLLLGPLLFLRVSGRGRKTHSVIRDTWAPAPDGLPEPGPAVFAAQRSDPRSPHPQTF